jgi:hypothetical protein
MCLLPSTCKQYVKEREIQDVPIVLFIVDHLPLSTIGIDGSSDAYSFLFLGRVGMRASGSQSSFMASSFIFFFGKRKKLPSSMAFVSFFA